MGREIDRVLVVGAGAMGTQIAALFAIAEMQVSVTDVQDVALDRSRHEASARVRRLAEKGTIDDADAVLARMQWGTDMGGFAHAADFILEAASERFDVKMNLFEKLGALAPTHAIIATNSSTIPSSQLAEASGRPDRVCNMHFFNPALVMRCVEVVPNPQTSPATIDTVVELSERMGKEVVRLNKEVPGFVANRLMNAIQDEATRLYAEGVASAEDIDRAATAALGHPLGPFALMDLVGLDVIRDMHTTEVNLMGDSTRGPHELLLSLTEAGHLGRKSGRGWFDYTGGAR